MTLDHPALPPKVSWPWLAVAAATWIVVGAIQADPVAETPPVGPVTVEGRLESRVVLGAFGPWCLLETTDGLLLLDFEDDPGLASGTTVRVVGQSDGIPGNLGSSIFGATVRVDSITTVVATGGPLLAVGESVRERVMGSLEPVEDGRALVAGFLIGETSGVDPSDLEAMRLAGLSHFVAVSGSNIALFLGLLAVLAGPLAWNPRSRAIVGLVGLPIYAAATRFEPSVMRASVMAGIVLVGRLIGVLLESWQLIALAVTVLIIAQPGLTGSVGFQLSVAATLGVLAGARWPATGRTRRALAVTVGAHVAVAPLLLAHFGTVPLLSPMVNLLAAPLVALATVCGALGALGVGPLTWIAEQAAEMVLTLARGASTWPQISSPVFIATLVVGAALGRWRALRLVLVPAASGLVVVWAIGLASLLPPEGAVVLDIGQGDAVLLHGGGGLVALVDGGPDPVALVHKLGRFGVTSLAFVVATHVHADHITGLAGLVGRYPIDEFWHAFDPHVSLEADELVANLEALGVPVIVARPGMTRQLGSLTIRVDAPMRRYESPNDQSIVLTVTGDDRTMLLSGDIESVAQRELDHLRADVLKVAHHGGATSDPEWLLSVGAGLAVISVGENSYGHPSPWVIDTLTSSGTVVKRTDVDGDIVIDLG